MKHKLSPLQRALLRRLFLYRAANGTRAWWNYYGTHKDHELGPVQLTVRTAIGLWNRGLITIKGEGDPNSKYKTLKDHFTAGIRLTSIGVKAIEFLP